jgi:hypothetical protein
MNRCCEGIGEGREQHAPRAPRLLFVRASMRLYKPHVLPEIRKPVQDFTEAEVETQIGARTWRIL